MLISNFGKMTDLLYKEWDLAKTASMAKGKTCAYIYLFEILSDSEKIVIKKVDNKLVGFAGYSKWNSRKYIIRKKFYGLLAKILINSPLVKNKEAIYNYNKEYDALPEGLDGYFDGEISILIVDKDYRNKGYGKDLLNKVFDLAKKDDMKNIQVLTDESCNYKFYESLGLKKKGETKVVFGEPNRKKEENYIYEKVLKEGVIDEI